MSVKINLASPSETVTEDAKVVFHLHETGEMYMSDIKDGLRDLLEWSNPWSDPNAASHFIEGLSPDSIIREFFQRVVEDREPDSGSIITFLEHTDIRFTPQSIDAEI